MRAMRRLLTGSGARRRRRSRHGRERARSIESGPKRITWGGGPSPPRAAGRLGPARRTLGYTSPMPELPEVEAARRLLMRAAVGRRIVSVRAAPDSIVFQGVSPARVRRALLGRRIVAAHRHGKHLWLE